MFSRGLSICIILGFICHGYRFSSTPLNFKLGKMVLSCCSLDGPCKIDLKIEMDSVTPSGLLMFFSVPHIFVGGSASFR